MDCTLSHFEGFHSNYMYIVRFHRAQSEFAAENQIFLSSGQLLIVLRNWHEWVNVIILGILLTPLASCAWSRTNQLHTQREKYFTPVAFSLSNLDSWEIRMNRVCQTNWHWTVKCNRQNICNCHKGCNVYLKILPILVE